MRSGLPIDFVVSYETPTLKLANSRYARWIASQNNHSTILIGAPDLYTDLDDPDIWFDDGHLRREGAEIYSNWLATRAMRLVSSDSNL